MALASLPPRKISHPSYSIYYLCSRWRGLYTKQSLMRWGLTWVKTNSKLKLLFWPVTYLENGNDVTQCQGHARDLLGVEISITVRQTRYHHVGIANRFNLRTRTRTKNKLTPHTNTWDRNSSLSVRLRVGDDDDKTVGKKKKQPTHTEQFQRINVVHKIIFEKKEFGEHVEK